MGTRHLIAVQHNNEYKIAQYGQWDGYPSGQGADVLTFLQNMDRDAFITALEGCSWLDEESNAEVWRSCGATVPKDSIDPDEWTITHEVQANWKKQYPYLSRDAGSDVLTHVLNSGTGLLLKNSIYFAADSLFCEYAYVIDFDKNTFEIYKGINQEPLNESERFFNADSTNNIGGKEYFPVRLIKTYSLDNLPTHEQFIADLEPQDEEEYDDE